MSEILKNWVAGKGLPDVLAIDGHIHVGAWPHAATFRDKKAGDGKLRFVLPTAIGATQLFDDVPPDQARVVWEEAPRVEH